MRPTLAIMMFNLALAGCGGSSETSVPASPGGEWTGFDSEMNPATLYVSELGEIRSQFSVPLVTDGQTFGAGSISVSNTDEISGVLEARGIQPSTVAPRPTDLGCTISANVEERTLLMANIVCADSDAIVYDQTIEISPQPRYETDSSLSAIAGNYTLSSRPMTNALNITSDGTLFGLYHNGANCTVNGEVSIIDAEYSLLWVEWAMSNCSDPFGFFEGTEMSGFAMPIANFAGPPESYYFFLTGHNARNFFTISIIFDPP